MDTKISGLYQTAHRVYMDLLAAGCRKEDARYVLPGGVATSLYVTGNFQAWRDFIKLRGCKEAQHEIRKVAAGVLQQLKEQAPLVFGDLDVYT